MPGHPIAEDYWEWLTCMELARARADRILVARTGAVTLPDTVDLHHARDAIAELVLQGWCRRTEAGWGNWGDDLRRLFATSGMRAHVDDLVAELAQADLTPGDDEVSRAHDLDL